MARPKGSKNKATLQRERGVKRSGMTPLEYMLKVMRDTRQPKERRDEMAKSAAPYVHARLASTQVAGDPDKPIEHEHRVEWVIVRPRESCK